MRPPCSIGVLTLNSELVVKQQATLELPASDAHLLPEKDSVNTLADLVVHVWRQQVRAVLHMSNI